MTKLKSRQYYVYKFNTSRLRKYHYDIKIDVEQAKKNGELVSLGDSLLLRALRRIEKKNTSEIENKLDELWSKKRELKKINKLDKSNKDDSKRDSKQLQCDSKTISIFEKLKIINSNIDDILHEPNIVIIHVDNLLHYKEIISNGLKINNKLFVRLLCGAGNARRNSVFMVNAEVENELKILLNNGRNLETEINNGKFNAYFGLVSSATLPVTQPKFAVVKDCEIERDTLVDFVEEVSGEEVVVTKTRKLPFNLWDGMGLVSPEQAKKWSDELGFDYTPSTFIIRSYFQKGMVCVFDFHKFCDEVCGNSIITDAWGNTQDLKDVEVITTQSMFKLWNTYDSCEEYIEKSNITGGGYTTWGISRYAKAKEDSYCFSNYQFLQALHIDTDKKVEEVSKMTIDYFYSVILGRNYLDSGDNANRDFNSKEALFTDVSKTLIYLLGKIIEKDYDPNIFYKIQDRVTKSLILKPELISDPYVQNHIRHSINKKIKESFMGNLLWTGFYTMMVNDPYAFCEAMMGMEVKGLLSNKQHYNKTWSDKGKDKIVAMRAPLTWESEVNVLNLLETKETQEWYKYLDNCIIYNVFGVDHMLHGGSDVDGDIVCLVHNDSILDSVAGGLPIDYETRKAKKNKIDDSKLYESDIMSFNTKIGFITNCSTTMYAMLPLFSKDSDEYKTIIDRLKICRYYQGLEIDRVKGLEGKQFPKTWTTRSKSQSDFERSITINKRPYFMRYLYPDYNKDYTKHIERYDNYSIANFGIGIKELLQKENLTEKESDTISKYNNYAPLLDSDCAINKICHYIESKISEIKNISNDYVYRRNKEDYNKIIMILKNNTIPLDKDKLDKMYILYKKYKSGKRNFSPSSYLGKKEYIPNSDTNEKVLKTAEQFNKDILLESFNISNDLSELANLAVTLCYEAYPSDNKSFAWNVFGDGLILNIMSNCQEDSVYSIPFLENKYVTNENSKSTIFLGETYICKPIIINNNNSNYNVDSTESLEIVNLDNGDAEVLID